MSFAWKCPFCNHSTTINDDRCSSSSHSFSHNNKYGALTIKTKVTVCPNEKCREAVMEAYLYKSGQYGLPVGDPQLYWRLYPRSHAKTFPSYVPQPILDDYEEACLIESLSPKASATLSRRCLQGIIRDFWGIKKTRLIDEVNELQSKIDTTTWQAIDAVRSLGNIGAHMEKEINVILDVEPEEAKLLTQLIEVLLQDWYVARHEKQRHLSSIIAAAEQKRTAAKREAE